MGRGKSLFLRSSSVFRHRCRPQGRSCRRLLSSHLESHAPSARGRAEYSVFAMTDAPRREVLCRRRSLARHARTHAHRHAQSHSHTAARPTKSVVPFPSADGTFLAEREIPAAPPARKVLTFGRLCNPKLDREWMLGRPTSKQFRTNVELAFGTPS